MSAMRCLLNAALCLLGLLGNPALADINVIVEGAPGELIGKIQPSLGIEQQKTQAELSDSQIRRLHARAQREIRQALQALGYYRPAIQADLTRTDSGWQARYRIYEGPPLPVDKLDLQITGPGHDDPELEGMIIDFALQPGEPFEHARYETAKRELLKQALSLGYLNATLTRHEVRIDLVAYTAAVAVHLETGQAYRFGTITVIQDALSPELIGHFITLKEGQPFRTAALLAQQNTLKDSDYFSEIDVASRNDQIVDAAVPIEIRLVTRRPVKYTLGVGYGTDTGARGLIGWERRLINPQGHRMNADFKLAERRSSITGRYLVPTRNPRTDHYAFTTGYANEYTEAIESHTFLMGVGRSIVRGNWQERLALNYQRESYTVGEQTDIVRVLFPEINWLRVTGDDRIFASRGNRFALNLRGSSDVAGSDVSFAQIRPQAKFIWTAWHSARLIARADVGYTSTDDFLTLPASLRFFTGGDQTVRGYAYNSLGPEDEAGNVIGGPRLLVGSIELEQRIAEKWSAAVFYDTGNALNDFADPLKEGAGIGLRWRSPVGQIRLDAASALSDPERPWRLHLNIGPDL